MDCCRGPGGPTAFTRGLTPHARDDHNLLDDDPADVIEKYPDDFQRLDRRGWLRDHTTRTPALSAATTSGLHRMMSTDSAGRPVGRQPRPRLSTSRPRLRV